MFRSMSNLQKGVLFYALSLIMAVAVALLGPDDDDLLQILNMLTPTVAVLLMLLVLTPDGYHRAGWAQLALHRPGWRSWPLALIAPTVIMSVSYGAAWLVGVLSFSFEGDALLNLIINIVIISLYAVFEEVGWRGYMLPHLGGDGSMRAALVVGFLHGVWHLPLMLLTTAYNPAGNRLITVPLFLAILTGAGVIYAYLRWTSGSLWPVIIAHGTLNAVLGTFQQAAVTPDPATAAYLTGETGVFTLAAVVIVAAVLARRYSARHEAPPGATQPSTSHRRVVRSGHEHPDQS
jgi:membrane protease YdiL (CAAX protease family)